MSQAAGGRGGCSHQELGVACTLVRERGLADQSRLEFLLL